MTTANPVLSGINLIARDMEATLAFYRRLGAEIPEPVRDSWFDHERGLRDHRDT